MKIDASILQLFILGCPILIFFVTGPKPQLFPQVITALALYLTVQKERLDISTYSLIILFVCGAAQQKLSFVLTGGVIGMWATCKIIFQKPQGIWIALILTLIFFAPRGWWNLQQVESQTMLTWLTPLPAEFTQQLQLYREQDWWFPFNLILPDSLGSFSAIIGIQVLLVITLRSQQRIWREVILLTVTAATLTYFLGQPIARSFYEFLLWIAVGISLSVNPEQISTTGIRALQFQSIAVLGMCGLGLWSLFPGVFSHSHREKVLHEAGYYYSAMDWANQNTNHDDVIASSLRSVAYLKTDFIPMDWEKLGIQNKNRAIYLKNMNYYLGSDCYESNIAKSNSLQKATRNPFNRNSTYGVCLQK